VTTQEHRVIRAEIVTRVFIVLVAALLAVTAYGVFLIRHQQVQSVSTLSSAKQASHDAAETAKVIKSCVDPDGRCYQRGQRRTADAVANINRVVILASACAVGQTGSVGRIQTAVQACVIDRLAADQRGNR
jgi:hypothetical protein